MRRGALVATWSFALLLLAASAGCTGPCALRRSLQDPPNPEQAARIQQASERAQAAFDRGDLEQARMDLLQLVVETPGSAQAHLRLGKILQLQGRLDESETCFRRALALDPDFVDALIGLGSLEAAKGDRQSALKRFETAIEIEPQDAEAHFACAGVLESMGRIDEALAAYFRTLEFNPLRPDVSQRIGAIQLARNQPDQALARLDQAVDLAPESGAARLLRGRAHLMLGHIPQSIADFRAAAQYLPNRPDVHYYLALALDAAHQRDDALKAVDQALRLAPNDVDARGLSQRLRR